VLLNGGGFSAPNWVARCGLSPALMSRLIDLQMTAALDPRRHRPPAEERKPEKQSNEPTLLMKRRFTPKPSPQRRPRHKAPTPPKTIVGFDQFNPSDHDTLFRAIRAEVASRGIARRIVRRANGRSSFECSE
jgi:hypothetical protein